MLEKLVGIWGLQRQVISTSGALIATMEGTASFSPCLNDTNQYYEEGALKMDDADQPPIVFSRKYIYRDEPGGLAIYFDENPLRLFQIILFTAVGDILEGSATHLCLRDIYNSHYQMRFPDTFQILHQVEGPRKSYTINTVYKRSPLNPYLCQPLD